MPALSIEESNSAVLVQTLVPLTPTVLESLQPETYLLVHSCRASATRQILRKVNNDGECYLRADFDFQMFFDLEAEVLSPYGLANWHPGANLTTGTGGSLPALACVNAQMELFRAAGGINILENPSLTYLPGDLPGLSFRIARENAQVPNTPGHYLPPPPPVGTVTTISFPPTPPDSGANYAVIYGVSTIALREYNLMGPVSGCVMMVAELEYDTTPLSIPAPVNLAAYYAAHPPDTNGVNDILEVVCTDVPGGRVLLPGEGLIMDLLHAGQSIPPRTGYRYVFAGTGEGGEPIAQNAYWTGEQLHTIPEFVAALRSPDDAPGKVGGILVMDVYSKDLGAWLPPV